MLCPKKLTLLVLTMSVAGCSESMLTAEKQGSRNNNKVADDDNSSQKETSDDDKAQSPQVVTGSYLGCIQDDISGAMNDEIAIGCGLYDQKTDKKIELSSKDLDISLSSSCGSELDYRTEPLSDESPYHAGVFIQKTDCKEIVVEASLSNGDNTHSIHQKVIHIKTIGDGIRLRDETPSVLTAWCGMATNIPYDASNKERLLVKGAACGADYLDCNGSYAPGIVSMISEISKALGGKKSLANKGICEESGKTFRQSEFVKRCQCDNSKK